MLLHVLPVIEDRDAEGLVELDLGGVHVGKGPVVGGLAAVGGYGLLDGLLDGIAIFSKRRVDDIPDVLQFLGRGISVPAMLTAVGCDLFHPASASSWVTSATV